MFSDDTLVYCATYTFAGYVTLYDTFALLVHDTTLSETPNMTSDNGYETSTRRNTTG